MRPVHGGNLAWAAAVSGCQADTILDFSASISPLGPPSSVLVAIQSQLGNLRHYPDPNYSELRVALSQAHQLTPEWILPGNGSAELLSLAGRELASLTATVLITPAFSDYYRALKAFEATVLGCPLLGVGEWGSGGMGDKREFSDLYLPLSPLALSPYPPIPPSHCGLLINNPHNPTGRLFSRASILPYLEQFALVVVDEAFMDFLPDQEQSLISLVQNYPNLVILRSLTKFFSLSGLRLGYALAHPDRLQVWQQQRDPWPVNTLAAAAGVAAISDRDFQQQTWDWLPPTREQLFQGLANIPGLHPYKSAANFLLVESQQSCSQLQQRLLQRHQILIRDCLSFPELGDRFFRVAVLSATDNQRLLAALREECREC